MTVIFIHSVSERKEKKKKILNFSHLPNLKNSDKDANRFIKEKKKNQLIFFSFLPNLKDPGRGKQVYHVKDSRFQSDSLHQGLFFLKFLKKILLVS